MRFAPRRIEIVVLLLLILSSGMQIASAGTSETIDGRDKALAEAEFEHVVKEAYLSLPAPFLTRFADSRHQIRYRVVHSLDDELLIGIPKNARRWGQVRGTFTNNTILVARTYEAEVEGRVVRAPVVDPVGVFYHEVGHAYDWVRDELSQSDEFRANYLRDIAALPPDLAPRFRHYLGATDTGAREAFAQALGIQLRAWKQKKNLNDPPELQHERSFVEHFPRVTKYVRGVSSGDLTPSDQVASDILVSATDETVESSFVAGQVPDRPTPPEIVVPAEADVDKVETTDGAAVAEEAIVDGNNAGRAVADSVADPGNLNDGNTTNAATGNSQEQGEPATLHVDVPVGARVTDIKVVKETATGDVKSSSVPSGANPTWSRYRHFKITGLQATTRERCKVEVHVSLPKKAICDCKESTPSCTCEEMKCCGIVYLRPGDEEVLSFPVDNFKPVKDEQPEAGDPVVVFVSSDAVAEEEEEDEDAEPGEARRTEGPFRFSWKNDDKVRIHCQISFAENLATIDPKFVPTDIQLGVDPAFEFPDVAAQGKPELSSRLWASSLAANGTKSELFGPIQLGAFEFDFDRTKRVAEFKLNEEGSLQTKLITNIIKEVTKNVVDHVHDTKARVILEVDGYVMMDGRPYGIGKYLKIEIRTKEPVAANVQAGGAEAEDGGGEAEGEEAEEGAAEEGEEEAEEGDDGEGSAN